jgi:hypothetical protein
MLAALGFMFLVDKDGFVPIKLERHGDYRVLVKDNVYSFPIWQQVLVLDSLDRVVFDHSWKEDGTYVELFSAPDFDSDGKNEVVVAEYNYSATGASIRLSVHSLGKRARNLLVLYTHSWGRLSDDDYYTREIDGQFYFVSWQNELPYWIGPRGGAPYPVVFAYSNGRLRPVTRGVKPILDEHIGKTEGFVDNPSASPTDYGDFYMHFWAAGTELATRTVSETPGAVFSDMRKRWSTPVMDFLEQNKEALLYKPTCHVYAEPYRDLPESPATVDVTANKPIWPKSTDYLHNPQEW